jgi:hypothetical protein
MSNPAPTPGPSSINLRKSVVEDFWKGRDPRIARILGWMESVEDWMVDDHEAVAGALSRLTQRIGQSNGRTLASRSDALLDIMAYMSSTRAMRLLEWLDTRFHNEIALQLVERAGEREEDPKAALLLDRLQTLRSLALLGRVFSPSRTRLVSELLGQQEQREQG